MIHLAENWYSRENYPNGFPLELQADGYAEGGGISPGQEDESFPNREPEYVHVERIFATRSSDRQSFLVGFNPDLVDEAYAVAITYETGDTFGRTSGEVYVADVYLSQEEAQAHVEYVRRIAVNMQVSAKLADFSYEYNGKKYYAPWTGYFERFEAAHVETIAITGARNQHTHVIAGTERL